MDRARKAARLVKVQARLHDLAESRLAKLVREGAELRKAEEELLGTMNADGVLHGLFVDVLARRLKSLAKEAERNGAEQVAQQAKVLEEAMRLKRTERLAEEAAREQRLTDERKSFQALLDAVAVKRDASLP
jgi:hypothetical protein